MLLILYIIEMNQVIFECELCSYDGMIIDILYHQFSVWYIRFMMV